MKSKSSTLRPLLFVVGSAALPLAPAHAQLTWDANGPGAGQTNGGGAWLGDNLWWNGATNQNWVAGSDAIFGGPNTAGGAVTLASPTSVGSLTFNTFTGTYTLGTLATALTIHGGITNHSAAGAVSLTTSPITLGASQTWTNNSSGATLARSGVNLAGHTLTIDGTGGTSFDATANLITGAGGLTKTGTGRLVLGSGGSVPVHNYTGTTTLNGGVTMTSNNNLGPGNLVINGGILEHYWSTNFTRTLGTEDGQVQIPGGTSGFSENGATGMNVILKNSAGFEVVWGGDFFKPVALVLQAASAQAGSSLNFQNKLDLNGANRTVAANGTALGVSATISGVIRNSDAVNAAGLIKTGPGLLILTGANTYDGGTTITQGNLRFGALTAMPATGEVAVQSGATLTIEVGGTGDWTAATSGNGSIGGLLSGLGGQTGGTVRFAGEVTLGLETTANLTYAGSIGNVGTSLSLAKSGGSSLTLSGANSYSGRTRVLAGTLACDSIGNIGGGDSALGAPATIADGTIDIGYRTTAATLRYTGSGHATDRVLNLSGTTGGATVDASGGGPLVLTSSPTATGAGAKTLTLTGANTAANSLATTSLPGLAETLTVQKSGAGTWWIHGFSSPKNTWSVTAGTLVASGNITTGDQNVTVSGGTLAGTGPFTLQSTKSLTIQAGGSLAPGNLAVGTLAVTGKLDLSGMAGGTGKLHFEMADPAGSDKIAVTGTAQIGTGLLGLDDFIFTDLGGMTSSTYVLISTTGGITGTLDPAHRSGTIGSIGGTLQVNGNNLEFTTDQDGDGLPDTYELANTEPASPTALDPAADLENGGAGDGLTNLQEYLLGTNPNNPDTDADGLLDGVETRTGVWVSAANTGTNPLVPDSDGDTLRDGAESNTGIFVSLTDPGTNPNKADSDQDGLKDAVETNTGTHVSKSDTGTNPNQADTDSDGAGDWYEVVIIDQNPALGSPPNSPNDPSLKPNIPYPLPAPDAATGATDKPVKVYIMSGQSNMVGFGQIAGTAPGTLQTMTGTENKFPNMVAAGGGWTSRKDVKYQGIISDVAKGDLKPDVAGDKYGPELGFGYVMGWYHDEPVLLIKASQGNRGLMWDFLPPGSPRTVDGATTYPAYGESPETWATTGGGPSPFVWYAGKQYDDCFLKEGDMGPAIWAAAVSYPKDCQVRLDGVTYLSKAAHTSNLASQPGTGEDWQLFWSVYSVFNTADILDNWATEYPSWAAQGFEIAGFVWWQGYDDTGEPRATRYEPNMVRFIKQIRTYYATRYPGKTVPNAPFVLATLATNGGWGNPDPGHLKVANAQLAVDGKAGKHPEFAGNVKTIEARGFWRDSASSPNNVGYHYNWNAETYLLVGDALGRAMVELNQGGTPPEPAYKKWTAGPFAATLTNSDPALDFDGGSLSTGIEWVAGGDPTRGADDAGLAPTLDTASNPAGKVLFTFRRTAAAGTDPATTIQVQYGSDLTGWLPAIHQGTAADQITITEVANGFGAGIDKVTVALPASLAASGKLFARLRVVVAVP
jgi:autotransporter-associated beta strand protein